MDKEKLKNEWYYFWTDYKWPFLAGLVVLGVLASFVITALTKKEEILSVMLLDCHAAAQQEQMESDYEKAAGIDTGRAAVLIRPQLMISDTTSGTFAMSSLSAFMADIGSELLDVCAMGQEDFIKYVDSGSFLDLRRILTPEELESFGDGIFEKDGVVYGISSEVLPVLSDYGCYMEAPGIIGVIYNTPHLEQAAAYLRYLAGKGV